MKVLAVLALALLATAVDFSGHKIVRLVIRDQSDADFLQALPEQTDGVTGVDVLSNDGLIAVGDEAVVRLTPAGYAAVVARGMQHTVQVEDVAANIARVAAMNGKNVGPINDDWYYDWHTFDDIQTKLQEIAAANPDITEWIPDIATSHEGRKVGGLRLGVAASTSNVSVLTAGTHAREWIGEAVAMWSIQNLIDDWNSKDTVATNIIKNSNVYIIPCYNPDGYTYTWEHNRYWRKNRRHNSGGSYGVDQNRNWDDHWCTVGASKVQTDDTYCGPSAASEPEVQGVANFIESFGERVKMHLDFHSYAKLILRPYGWTSKACPDDVAQGKVGTELVNIIKESRGTKYTSERIAQLYLAAGGPNDYFYAQLGTVLTYTFELGGSDFVVPASDIEKQSKEIYPAVKRLFELGVGEN